MKTGYSLKLFAGDLTGGIITSLTALPASIAFGCYVFAPLGPDGLQIGVISGLISLAFLNISSAFLNGNGIMNSGPFSLTSLMMASSLTYILGRTARIEGSPATIALSFLFLIVLMVGIMQVLTGVLRLGELIKYIPYPVLAGLFNGTAVLFIFGEMGPLLGINGMKSAGDIVARIHETQPLTLVVGATTLVAAWKGNALAKKIPAPILGIAAGTLLYYTIRAFAGGNALGPVIGTIPSSLPVPHYIDDFILIFHPDRAREYLPVVVSLVPMALGISVILSLRTLLTMVAADNITQGRSSASRELVGQGIGNILSSFFGGIAGSGNISRTMGNYMYGARTSVSRVICGLSAIATLVFLNPVVSLLPRVVIAGILIYLGFIIFDKWSIALLRQLVFGKGFRSRELLLNISIVTAVTVIMVTVGIFESIGIGIAMALVLFVLRMGRNIVRRQYNASRIISNVERPLGEIRFLENEGHRIHIMELEGPLFFGTTDRISNVINGLLSTGVEYIILDFRKVNDIDSTGMNILAELGKRCRKNNKLLLLSSLTQMKKRFGMQELMEYNFDTLEDALAWAEDRLIERDYPGHGAGAEIPLSEIDALSGLSKKELSIIARYLKRRIYKNSDIIFCEGDPGGSMFFISSGRARIELNPSDASHKQRLSTLGTGTVFGEMAILEGQPRMADAVAEQDMVCLELTCGSLERMKARHPSVSYKVIEGIARDLSKRLRVTHRILSELKE